MTPTFAHGPFTLARRRHPTSWGCGRPERVRFGDHPSTTLGACDDLAGSVHLGSPP
jgi:hypothetical protein